MTEPVRGVELLGPAVAGADEILSPAAIAFLADLERRFRSDREALLARRVARHAELDAGALPGFLPETADVRAGDWTVASAPADLDDRRVEITGPAEPKMMINALNSGARVFMADFEDALSPSWPNVIAGQLAVRDAIHRTLTFETPQKAYRLNEETATLVVRPRGWHLPERHLLVDGRPMSASLFDAGLFLFHGAAEALARGSGPYLYLPKLESHLEARLWNDVFVHAQAGLGIPRGSVRATVLIETILAAFEMDEILHELREHAAGLNAGRWDYIFSVIKRFRDRSEFLLPDRGQVTMAVPFMRAYARLLVATCHRRGAHAIGGMSAFIPNRRQPEVTANALARVREDKEREAGDGFDGTWVAHPDLVPVTTEVFDRTLGERPNQKSAPGDPHVTAEALLDVAVPGGRVSDAGARQ
ncbi:MAG TPA: malate synthase A, partial [Candidatus Limnocylindrales bacterium]|nr:malate synthase A [Candidatus Limnocylindrales bacterium]